MRRRALPPVRDEAPWKWRRVYARGLPLYALYALAAGAGALAYANSLGGEFVHDDIPAIVSNADVSGANGLLALMANDFWGTPMAHPSSHKSYRPLTTLSFRLNQWWCGGRVWWWHAVNVALHAACCALVAALALALRLRAPAAALAGLLFAVHPVHTEAVAGIVGRADVLACFFFLISVLLYHGCLGGADGCGGGGVVWGSVAAAALSTLAKETGLTALAFNLAFDLYRCWAPGRGGNSWSRRARWRVARALPALLALLGARLALLRGALPAFSAMDNPPAFHPSLTVRVLTFSYLAARNWWALLCPCALAHDWQLGSVPALAGGGDARNLLTAAAALAALALACRCLADLEVQRHAPAVAGLLLLVIPYLPASNVLVTVGFVVAERVLYIPSVGSVLLTAYGIQLLWQRCESRRLLVVAVAILVASGAARTHLRNRDWRTRETLLRADLAVLPHNAKLHYNFANFLKDTGQQEGAIDHYKEALRLWPGYASAHNNLGTLMVGAGRAEHHFLQALRHNRDHVNAHYNLGKLYRKRNLVAEAVQMLERCISLEPRFVQAYVELVPLAEGGRRRELLQALLGLEPRNHDHRLLYGHWYRDRGLLPLALQQYSAALDLALRGSGESSRPPAPPCAAALALRALGQRARMLQLVLRWQAGRRDAQPADRRLRAARAWRLRAELEGRAARYRRPNAPAATAHHHKSTSTCLHHSHLEVAQASAAAAECPQSEHPSDPHHRPTHNRSEPGPEPPEPPEPPCATLKPLVVDQYNINTF